MTLQIGAATLEQNPTRWQKLLAWLTAIDEAFSYDPQEHTNTTIRELKVAVAQLETRVVELEGCDQHISASIETNVIGRR